MAFVLLQLLFTLAVLVVVWYIYPEFLGTVMSIALFTLVVAFLQKSKLW